MNDAAELRRNEHLASAFADLEGPIDAIKNMSTILESIMGHDIQRRSGHDDASGYISVLLTEDQFDSLHFAVTHLDGMIGDLYRSYYKAVRGNRSGDEEAE